MLPQSDQSVIDLVSPGLSTQINLSAHTIQSDEVTNASTHSTI